MLDKRSTTELHFQLWEPILIVEQRIYKSYKTIHIPQAFGIHPILF